MLERNLGNRRQTRIRVHRNQPAMKMEGHMYAITESLSPIVAVHYRGGLTPIVVWQCGVYTVAMPYLILISRWFRRVLHLLLLLRYVRGFDRQTQPSQVDKPSRPARFEISLLGQGLPRLNWT